MGSKENGLFSKWKGPESVASKIGATNDRGGCVVGNASDNGFKRGEIKAFKCWAKKSGWIATGSDQDGGDRY